MLNSINTPIVKAFADIQNAIADNIQCATLEQECAYMVAGGQERVYLNQLATSLTGRFIAMLNTNFVPEEEIRVFPEDAKRSYIQSLNDSIKMVAVYSVLMSGYTSQDIIESALINWVDYDQVTTEKTIDFKLVAGEIIKHMQAVGMLSTVEDSGQLSTGEWFKAYPSTDTIQELRIKTMHKLWDSAPPKMKPMLHKLTWQLDGTCELKNLSFKFKVKQAFIDALNKCGHTGYSINPVIRAKIARNLLVMQYPTEQVQAMNSMLTLQPNTEYFFPHTPDYRGRFYARGGLTTFQGVKDIRAAFDFKNSTKVDEYGLFLHIANAYGKDKISITERIQWVKDNHNALVNEPQTNLYTERARLAYVEYKETGFSNIICRIDGTCSGVQITSGLFLDANTGFAVNVGKSSPDDQPEDLYRDVFETALKLARSGVDKAILTKYGRNITKDVIMILAYGAGETKLIETISDFLIANGERASNAKSLYKLIMHAIANDYPSITKLNENLKVLFTLQSHTKLTYNLDDITVVLKPTNTEHLNLYGSKYTGKLVGKKLPDADALLRGLSPNFVHSLDSNMLRHAINSNITDVSAIHDDIGTQSADVRYALQAIRTAYVNVIKSQPLKELYRAMSMQDMFEQENHGLVLNDVLESAYLYS